MLGCECGNVKLRVLAAQTAAASKSVSLHGVSFDGPFALGLGGCSSTIPALCEEQESGGLLFRKCLNCGVVVCASTPDASEVYVNVALRGGSGHASSSSGEAHIPSKAFGICLQNHHVQKAPKNPASLVEALANDESKIKLNRMLEHYKESVETEKAAKIQAFVEKVELEAKALEDEARADAELIWSKIQAVRGERAAAATAAAAAAAAAAASPLTLSGGAHASASPSGAGVGSSSVGISSSVAPGSSVGAVAGSAPSSSASDAAVAAARSNWTAVAKRTSNQDDDKKGKFAGSLGGRGGRLGENRNNNANVDALSSSSGQKKSSPSDSGASSAASAVETPLWSMDEELDERNPRAFAPDASPVPSGVAPVASGHDSDNDEDLAASASGLLPSTRKVLFGSPDDSGDSDGAGGSATIVAARSVPVSIPAMAFGGRARSSSTGRARDLLLRSTDEDDGGKFERPDVLAANTWQEQVRADWVEMSQKKLHKPVTDQEDLEFLVAAAGQRDEIMLKK